ncbi:Glycosyl transferases group 1 family protein (fragment) [Candidatus Desulfosporosinus infrequens]|uniref:Glycosyl transferases group 1 family protein n=1 Tax=Candidatus Desulfosporosinus infrequens TaxID=2043169 RepID=A0A2U3LLF3_9FIRM
MKGIVWGLFKWFHGFSELNFCPSHDTWQVLESKGIENLRIWSRGIDTSAFNPNYKNLNIRADLNAEDKTIFLYVGRLAPEKDLDILMESIDIVNSSHVDKVQFILVGDGPYAQQMKEHSFDNVEFTGYLKGRELSAMYASSDVFVFPSSTETFGNVVLEAMASGLPVIAVNSGGVKENVIHNFNGLMCPPRDAISLATAIIKLAEEKQFIESLTANAREHVATKSWSYVFDQLVSDYCSVLAKTRSKLSQTA